MKTSLSLAILLTLPAFVLADEAAPKGDLGRLQGKWTAKVGPNRDIAVVLAIKGNAVTATGTTPEGRDFEISGEIKVDDQARPHPSLDWVKFVGPEGNEMPDNLGIYKFDDKDTVLVCNGGPGKERPTEFKAGDGEDSHLITLHRKKD